MISKENLIFEGFNNAHRGGRRKKANAASSMQPAQGVRPSIKAFILWADATYLVSDIACRKFTASSCASTELWSLL